jgi:L-ascorbate metabolism protein UlaG (beta-lactamase superfamily)
MPARITCHGRACFGIQTETANLLIDPFLTGNAMAEVMTALVNPS